MPDELNYPTAHDIARKLLEGPDLPLFECFSENRVIDLHIKDTRIHFTNVDEYGMPSNPSSEHVYYYLVHKNDPYNFKLTESKMLARFGHRWFAEEYLKTQFDKIWVIKEATNDEYMKIYREVVERFFSKV